MVEPLHVVRRRDEVAAHILKLLKRLEDVEVIDDVETVVVQLEPVVVLGGFPRAIQGLLPGDRQLHVRVGVPNLALRLPVNLLETPFCLTGFRRGRLDIPEHLAALEDRHLHLQEDVPINPRGVPDPTGVVVALHIDVGPQPGLGHHHLVLDDPPGLLLRLHIRTQVCALDARLLVVEHRRARRIVRESADLRQTGEELKQVTRRRLLPPDAFDLSFVAPKPRLGADPIARP